MSAFLSRFLPWSSTAVLAAALLSLDALVAKQHAEIAKQHAENVALQQQVEALLERQEQSQRAEEAARGRLMAQVRDLQNQLYQAHALLNPSKAAPAIPLGDQLKDLPSSMYGKTIDW